MDGSHGDKENVAPPASSLPAKKMSSELFASLFLQGRREPELVDLTSGDACVETCGDAGAQGGLAGEVQVDEDPVAMGPSGEFCSHCLVSLSPHNFLAKLQHVKACGNAKIVDGRRAVARFLSYYGYEELQEKFEGAGVGLGCLRHMDAARVEEVTGVGGLQGRTKFVFALEQYRESGRLQVRASLLDGAGGRGFIGGGEKRGRATWARSTRGALPSATTAEERGISKTIPPPLRQSPPPPSSSSSLSLDRVLLESLWTRPRRAEGHDGNRVSVSCSTLWTAAAACQSNHTGLEDRLQRAQATGKSRKAAPAPSIAGNIATKRVRLKAMQDELNVQQQTVQELKEMIAELQREIDADVRGLGRNV
jgi:hypothetical protein